MRFSGQSATGGRLLVQTGKITRNPVSVLVEHPEKLSDNSAFIKIHLQKLR